MKYDNKDLLKKKCVELYLKGNTMSEISKIVNCSRNYVGQLLKDDFSVAQYKNSSRVKVNKLKNQKRMLVSISTNFLKKIGISEDKNTDEYVEVAVDDVQKIITIRKI